MHYVEGVYAWMDRVHFGVNLSEHAGILGLLLAKGKNCTANLLYESTRHPFGVFHQDLHLMCSALESKLERPVYEGTNIVPIYSHWPLKLLVIMDKPLIDLINGQLSVLLYKGGNLT